MRMVCMHVAVINTLKRLRSNFQVDLMDPIM